MILVGREFQRIDCSALGPWVQSYFQNSSSERQTLQFVTFWESSVLLQAQVTSNWAFRSSVTLKKPGGCFGPRVECSPANGGCFPARSKQEQLVDVVSVVPSSLAFAALKADGTVVCWGDPQRGARRNRIFQTHDG